MKIPLQGACQRPVQNGLRGLVVAARKVQPCRSQIAAYRQISGLGVVSMWRMQGQQRLQRIKLVGFVEQFAAQPQAGGCILAAFIHALAAVASQSLPQFAA